MEMLIERSFTMDELRATGLQQMRAAKTRSRRQRAKEVEVSERAYSVRRSAADAITDAAHGQKSFAVSAVLASWDGPAFGAAVQSLLKRAEQGGAVIVTGDTCFVRDEDSLCETAYHGLRC